MSRPLPSTEQLNDLAFAAWYSELCKGPRDQQTINYMRQHLPASAANNLAPYSTALEAFGNSIWPPSSYYVASVDKEQMQSIVFPPRPSPKK
jgi:hypothetical protein